MHLCINQDVKDIGAKATRYPLAGKEENPVTGMLRKCGSLSGFGFYF